MRSPTDRGRVYRRCGCRDAHGHQFEARCPGLRADPGHGTWTFAVDIPNPVRRTTIRRGGYSIERHRNHRTSPHRRHSGAMSPPPGD